MLQPAGAMNVLPCVVVRGVSAASFSSRASGADGGGVGAAAGAEADGAAGSVAAAAVGTDIAVGLDGDEQAATSSVTVHARMGIYTIQRCRRCADRARR